MLAMHRFGESVSVGISKIMYNSKLKQYYGNEIFIFVDDANFYNVFNGL